MLSPFVIAAVAPSIVVSAFNTQQVGRPSTALNKFKRVKWTPQTGSHVSIPPFNPHHGVGDNGPTLYAPSNYEESGGVIQQQTTSAAGDDSYGFVHAPLDYFAFDNLSSKGPRATYDWGEPQDWSRKLADDGVFRGGTWYCTEGGWESPNGKAVTEVFYMLEGHGMLGDSDGTKHYFGPGDMVIIPKGHTGRWDVNTAIHKVWAVNAHDNIEESGPIIRVQVDHDKDFSPQCLYDSSLSCPLYGNTGNVESASNTFYDVGPTKVGVWTSNVGTFEVQYGERQWFHMLEGTMYITDSSDGTSKRCVPGDTVMLPMGWSGFVDVVEPVKKVFTVAK